MKYRLALLSGVLVGTSYIPFPPWALLFCYVPLWCFVIQQTNLNKSSSSSFFAGWLTQFSLSLIGFNWIIALAQDFGGFGLAASFFILLFFACVVHLYIPLSSLFSVLIFKFFKVTHPLKQFLILALSLGLWERFWPSLFKWNLAYTLLWAKIPLYQWADIIGFWGLSVFILIIQAWMAYAWLLRKDNKNQARKILAGVFIFILIFSILGFYKSNKWSIFNESLQIGFIQPNITNEQKMESELKENFQSHILEKFISRSNDLLAQNPETEILFWPETAMPFPLDPYFHKRSLQSMLLNKIKTWNVFLFTGGYSQNYEKINHLGQPVSRNSIFFLDPLHPEIQTYHKTDLLIFGEYLPFGKYIPSAYKYFPNTGVYETGNGPEVKTLLLKNNKEVKVGPQICYESLEADFSRELAAAGADIFINLTNDAWFGHWAEPYQHNVMAQARAIENRRPLIRSTNSGVSSLIIATGEVITDSPVGIEWTAAYKLNYIEKAKPSFYTRYGHHDWVFWICLLLLIIFI